MATSVLVVDDHQDILDLPRTMLDRQGFEALTATTPSRAPAILEQSIPHVLVLDILIPERSGVELLEHIRGDDRLAELPVLCMSSYVAGGAGEVIRKYSHELVDKVHLSDVVERVQEIVGPA